MAKSSPMKNAVKKTQGGYSVNTIRLLFVAVVILLYGQCVGFDFTLDDDLFIRKNAMVQKGISGLADIFTRGSLNESGIQPYRPVTLTSFVIEKVLFNNSKAIAHLINLLLYMGVLQILYLLIRKLFSDFHYLLSAAIVLLFAAHPLHTEVVASIKGRDELLAALFGLFSWYHFLPVNTGAQPERKAIIFGSLFFVLALLSKESAIAFAAIIPLSWLMFRSYTLKSALMNSLPLLSLSFLFMLVRYLILGTEYSGNDIPLLANVLNAANGFAELSATKCVILFHNLKLLFFPWPLVWDRSYNQIPLANWNAILPWLGLISYASLLIYALFRFRRNTVISFSIIFFFLASAPTNNLFFISGAVLGERFLFVPSIAFSIAVCYLIAWISKLDISNFEKEFKKRFAVLFAVLFFVFSVLTFARVPDWKNNLALFRSGVEVAPNSSRTQYSLASEYMGIATKTADINERNTLLSSSLVHFRRSLEIFPDNFQALYNTGICCALSGDTAGAIQSYRKTIQLNNKYMTAMNNLAVIYEARKEFDSAAFYYKMALSVMPGEPVAVGNLSNMYFSKGLFLSQLGRRDEALLSYKTSISYNANNVMSINNVASLYTGVRQFDSALVYLRRGYEVDARNQMIVENIAAVSFLSQNYTQAIEYARKGLELNSTSRKSLGVLSDCYQAMGNVSEAEKYRQLMNRQ